MREIVFDTETTGLDPFSGDKLVEIGAIELINHVQTGVTYHQYINPMRSIPEEVVKVHGLTEDFLKDKPIFSDICDEFIEFVGDAKLVAHNASFDMKFINCELDKAGRSTFDNNRVIDTLIIARKKFPGSKVNLDELCKKFKIDNSHRVLHGALLDAQLLAEVYLELLGGSEPGLVLGDMKKSSSIQIQKDGNDLIERVFKEARLFDISEEEKNNHQKWLEKVKDAVWLLD